MHKVTALILISAGRAAADEPDPGTSAGIAVMVGAGGTGFLGRTMRELSSDHVGGAWDVRAIIGARTQLAIEVSYIGTAMRIGTGGDAQTLVGTGAEATLRWNILPHAEVTPFLFAGLGFTQYNVTGDLPETMHDDQALEAPMGIGAAYRRGRLEVELRGTVRISSDGLVRQPDGDMAPLHAWGATAEVGWTL